MISYFILFYLKLKILKISFLIKHFFFLQEKLSSISFKIKKIAKDFRKFTMTEIQRSFDSKTPESQMKLINKDHKEKVKKEPDMTISIPNYQIIFEFDLLLHLKAMNDYFIANEFAESEEKKEFENIQIPNLDEKKNSFLNSACQNMIIKNLEFSGSDNEDERILKDCMILQGGFHAILTAISKTTGEVQLELLSTLINLLAHNSKNKLEFK